MTTRAKMCAALGLAFIVAGVAVATDQGKKPGHSLPEAKDSNLVVGLCDGETAVEVSGVKEGEAMTREQAQQVSDALMTEWRRKNPDAHWDEETQLAQASAASGAKGVKKAIERGQGPTEVQSGDIYKKFGERDEKIWQASTEQFVQEGKRIFHDAQALGGTIGVSCDMCHPDAANTHPETYPKYQVQLGRVALLRDMINWCIENPVRGKPLPDGDDKIKALEAYILAQRKGTALEYGKH